MMSKVRPALLSDAVYIADRMRSADVDELSLYDISPKDALVLGLNASLQPLSVICDGMPCAMFGVAPTATDGIGSVWLLGTPDLFTIKVPFLRQSEMWLNHCSKPFSGVGNWVDSRNHLHIRWLRWLGFDAGESILVKNTQVTYYFRKTN